MAVRPAMQGQNVGGAILFWAMMKARREGKQYLRSDCLAGNGRLRRYYEEQIFIYRGEAIDRDYTAALYELALDEIVVKQQ
jgi:GNAT superfamily N-acetyltransferase